MCLEFRMDSVMFGTYGNIQRKTVHINNSVGEAISLLQWVEVWVTYTEEAEEGEEGYPQSWLTRIELSIVGHSHLMTRPLNQINEVSTAYYA